MRIRHLKRSCAVIGAVAVAAFAPPPARGQLGPVVIKPNVQVSDPYGPDAIEGTPDDDPKAQNETVIATSPTTTGLLLVGANASFFAPWCDTRNWHPDRNPERGRLGDIYFAEIEIPPGDGVGPDFDADCDVDLGDYGVFSSCFNGSGRPPAPTCPPGVDSDFDADGDVDLDDFAIFAECNTGELGGCPWDQGESARAPSGGGDPEADAPDDPSVEDLYRRLEAYCEENGIPFT